MLWKGKKKLNLKYVTRAVVVFIIRVESLGGGAVCKKSLCTMAPSPSLGRKGDWQPSGDL